RGIQDFFPGKQIGQGIGNTIAGATQAIQQHSWQPLQQAANENSQNAPKMFGDAANAMLTAASPMVAGGAAPGITGGAGRIGANVALGAGLGATNSVSQADTGGDI